MAKPEPRVETSVRAVAAIIGVSETQLHAYIRDGMPRRETEIDGRYEYVMPDIVRWLVERRDRQLADAVESKSRKPKSVSKNADVPDDDPLLMDADSYYGELYRKRKAEAVEVENQMKRGELVRVDSMRQMLTAWAAPIRRAGEQLQRQFGEEAAGILRNAVEDCKAVLKGGDVPGLHED